MRLFLAHAIGADDGPIPSRLQALAAVYGMALVLPDRTRPLAARKQAMSRCDAFLALGLESAAPATIDELNDELRVAGELNLPLVALIEDGLRNPKDVGNPAVVRFDRHQPARHEAELMERLQQLRAQRPPTPPPAPERQGADPTIALGVFAGLALALVGLGALALAVRGPTEDEDGEDAA